MPPIICAMRSPMARRGIVVVHPTHFRVHTKPLSRSGRAAASPEKRGGPARRRPKQHVAGRGGGKRISAGRSSRLADVSTGGSTDCAEPLDDKRSSQHGRLNYADARCSYTSTRSDPVRHQPNSVPRCIRVSATARATWRARSWSRSIGQIHASKCERLTISPDPSRPGRPVGPSRPSSMAGKRGMRERFDIFGLRPRRPTYVGSGLFGSRSNTSLGAGSSSANPFAYLKPTRDRLAWERLHHALEQPQRPSHVPSSTRCPTSRFEI